MASVSPAAAVGREISFESENYLMRTLKPADATDRFSVWFEAEDVREMLNLPRQKRTKADMEAYIRSFDQRMSLLLGIFAKADGLLVGIFSLYVDWAKRHFIANTVVGEPAYRHKGLMMEVTPPFRAYFFNTCGLKVMTATALAHNAPIRAYLENTGWTLDRIVKGEVKPNAGGAPIDLCHYSLTADAWNQWYAKHGGARRTV